MRGLDAFAHRLIGAVPFGSRMQPHVARLAAFGDQGLQGVANLAVNIVLARSLTHEGFATIGTMLGVHYFVASLHRTAIVLPFILDVGQGDDGGTDADGRWWWLNLAWLAAIAVCLAAIAGIAAWLGGPNESNAWFVDAMALAVLVTPALQFYEFGRRCLFQAGLPVTAALASGCYLLASLGLALALLRFDVSATAGAAAWLGAGVLGGAVAAWALPPGRPRLREGFEIWSHNRGFAFWQTMTSIPHAIYNASVVVLVGLINGPLAAAAFNAARSITNPAVSMVTAVDSLDKPRAARALASDGLAGLRQSVGKTRRLLALVTGLYLGTLIIFAEPILMAAFGPKYADQTLEIRILGLVFFAMCMNQPSDTFLIVLRASRLLLTLRIVTASVAVGFLLLARPYGLVGCCLALLATHLFNLVALRIGERIASRRFLDGGAGSDARTGPAPRRYAAARSGE
ncbi:hypothetical protein B2G71_05225 [Novosphingobium sp. PC22D]|uniref:lipopolysaccharide biosynthesis protein n=1 Tax=Novosphingobium sp. PC22D TaxID=1962403 RepID=UPI000BF08C01|nr:oligosaccharide flippase family protein [Novosphingobium sp. PC22D]PEQ13723.1 hypothetical protein B2G71_05225 [Novosphingobium sp. PC22D]